MDISVFFQPINDGVEGEVAGKPNSFGFRIHKHFKDDFPELEDVKLAFFGVNEDRLSEKEQYPFSDFSNIREKLYHLNDFDGMSDEEMLPIADLGTILAGETYEDTTYAVRSTCEFLLKKKIIPIIIGGTQDLTWANYLAYEKLEQVLNLVTIDRQLDLGLPEQELSNENYLKSIILHKPNYLFNLTNIGSQRPYTTTENLSLFSKMYFDNVRLGKIFENVVMTEPYIRNADILSFDLSAIRYSDAFGSAHSGPNGLYANQACQLCKYAGMSDKLTSFGVYEYHAHRDVNGVTAQLVAEMIWYFIDGFFNRKKDFPIGSKDDYIKYIVPLQTEDHQIVFYKSPKTNRWWMEVPYSAGTKNKYYRQHIIPCSYEDYQAATNDDLPNRWWSTYQKLAH